VKNTAECVLVNGLLFNDFFVDADFYVDLSIPFFILISLLMFILMLLD